MSGGGKTKTTTSQNQTSNVTLPAWVTSAAQGNYNAAAANTAAPTPYTGELSPGNSANQTAASNLAAGAVGTGQGDLDAARGYTGAAASGTVQPVTAGTFDTAAAQQYADPYLAQVQQNTLSEMQRQNAIDNQGIGDAAQAAGAYGGARQALLEGEAQKNQSRNMTDYLAQSNSDAYNDAASKFAADRAANMAAQTTNAQNEQSILDRLLSAGGQAANIGGAASGLTTQDIANLEGTGAVDQNTQAAKDSAAYADYQHNQTAPLDYYQQLQEILSGSPKDVKTTGTGTGTSTTQQSGGLLNSLLGAGQIAASIWSDPRLKRDAALIERMPDGLGIYRFNYLWDEDGEPARIGVMADEVERIRPWALGPIVSGFRTVDYSKLGETLQ